MENNDELLRDYTRDVRYENRMSKLLLLAMILVLAIMIVGIVIICVHTQISIEKMAEHNTNTIIEFLSQYDYETTMDIQTYDNRFNAGNVNITK